MQSLKANAEATSRAQKELKVVEDANQIFIEGLESTSNHFYDAYELMLPNTQSGQLAHELVAHRYGWSTDAEKK